jgi:predicted ArsR family transcriptional regulator
MAEPQTPAPSRLEILKALGENTRYAIYLELARSPRPLATAEIATTLDLHANTVRPHLERMREVGLLDQRIDNNGGVGRPQHLYSLAPDAPSLGLEPPAMPALARMLLSVAAEAGLDGNDATAAGRDQGSRDADGYPEDSPCIEALMTQLEYLGFDPEATGGADGVTIAFTHCPFRELAEANPDLVCGLHRGMVEGFVDGLGTGQVGAFRTLVDRVPCQTDVVEVDVR